MSRYGSLATVSLIGGIVSILFPIVALFGYAAVIVSSSLSVTFALQERCGGAGMEIKEETKATKASPLPRTFSSILNEIQDDQEGFQPHSHFTTG